MHEAAVDYIESPPVQDAVADLGWFLGFHGTPLWAEPSTKKYYTDTSDRLN
jgi:hypothetical protein